MKPVKNVSLERGNEFSKFYKVDDIDIHIGKAVDEETDKHYLVFSVPTIPDLNVHNVQFPMIFNTAQERDNAFNLIDENYMSNLSDKIMSEIKERNSSVN